MANDAGDQAIIEAIVRNQKAENLRVDAVLNRRLASARDEARLLAAALGEIPGIRKVLLFGSVARGKPFTFDSDIDLAIEGGDILEAMAIAETFSFSVDVVDLAEDMSQLELLEGKVEKARARIEAGARDELDWAGLDIPGLRPPLFDKACAKRIDELRRFRHAFRNVYASELDPEKLGSLARKMPALLADFRPVHERYQSTLSSIAKLLED